jgi:hypothetical protein
VTFCEIDKARRRRAERTGKGGEDGEADLLSRAVVVRYGTKLVLPGSAPCASLGSLDLAILGRRGRDQGIEQPSHRRRDFIHGVIEGRLVGDGRASEAAHLANELERRRPDLLVSDGRLEVVQGSDIPAHV